jgi:hypothetical protein
MSYKKLYLKITTVPNQSEVDLESRELEVFKEKYESHKGYLKDQDVELSYLNEASVNGSFARVFSITLGFNDSSQGIIKTIMGEEIDILNKLLEILRHDSFKNAEIVTYNRSFTYSFLSKRFRKNKIMTSIIDKRLNVYNEKAWTIKGKCIQDYVKGISYQTENFSETCFIHDIPLNIVDGADVFKIIKKGNTELINQSDLDYVYALMRVDCELSGDTISDNPQFHTETIGRVEKQSYSLLDHILSSAELSTKTVKAIVEFTEKEQLNREDVLVLVRAALSNSKEKVEEEDYQELKTALGLDVDYSKIQVIVDKGNLGAKEAKQLISDYGKTSYQERVEMISLVDQYLTEHNKITQVTAQKQLAKLDDELVEDMENKYFRMLNVMYKDTFAKTEANYLISEYKNSSAEEKEEVIGMVEDFLKERGKADLSISKNSLLFLKENLT